MNKLTKYSDEYIKDVLEKSISFSDVLRHFGYESITTGSFSTVKNELKKRDIIIPVYNYFNEYNNFNGGKREKNIEKLFVENSTTSRHHLKKLIIRNDLIKYECECGNKGEWRNKKLVLQLDHKNGDTYDNRLENLCFLCPNCHSQTETFSGKNSQRNKKDINKKCKCGKKISLESYLCINCYSISNRKVIRPSYEQLKKEIYETSQNKVAKKYGVSWRTIRKWLIFFEKNG